MIDFLDILEKEVWKKRFFAFLSFMLFIALLLSVIYRGERKSWKDKVKEYVVCRFNFTPNDVERAYFSCPYRANFFGYEILAKKEIEALKRAKVFSWFYPEKISKEKREIVVVGKRITGEWKGSEIKNVQVYRVKIKLGVKRGYYVKSVER
ncbi:MAG TPA: hypothetical protein EYH58_00125 [Aquifex aeolicus]|nr:hypothetical protein [Aquifex aeolicus]